VEDERRRREAEPLIKVIVVAEGQTEETFVRDVLAPVFGTRNVFLYARPIATSKRGKGGALSRDRVLSFLRKTLRESSTTYVTTLFDLYGLRPDFPGVADASGGDPITRCAAIEASFESVVAAESGCRPDRFLAHIQPYEFEALLFSDVSRFGEVQSGWNRFVPALQQARDEAESPEHINDGPRTHPSARLEQLREPSYDKPLHGSRLAERIGIDRMRSECSHFDGWLTRIETLPSLSWRDPTDEDGPVSL
jgi:hypothetical protein